MPERPYIYYDFTLSICSTCLRRVDAKIVFEGDNVYMLKNCRRHGFEKVLIATDIEYYKNCRNYAKRSEMPLKFNKKTHYGCPYDCGLCQDHEQHSCLTVVEVTDRCNLSCPTCYAMSSPSYGRHRTLEEIEQAALQDHGAERADDNDDECRRLDQRPDFPTFDCLPDDDTGDGKHQPRYATPVHAFSRRLARRREMAWLCSWQTRDSETPMTAPISFKFISCS